MTVLTIRAHTMQLCCYHYRTEMSTKTRKYNPKCTSIDRALKLLYLLNFKISARALALWIGHSVVEVQSNGIDCDARNRKLQTLSLPRCTWHLESSTCLECIRSVKKCVSWTKHQLERKYFLTKFHCGMAINPPEGFASLAALWEGVMRLFSAYTKV